MPYAANGVISQSPIEGGIVISETEYQEGLAGKLAGKDVSIDGGFRVALPPEPEPEPEPAPTLEELRDDQLAVIERARMGAESQGVKINGIRYAGDPSNRQALREALDLTERTGQTTFTTWKDSDGVFHADHLVSDVEDALLAIAARRSSLITREGQLAAEIVAAYQANDPQAILAVVWTYEEPPASGA